MALKADFFSASTSCGRCNYTHEDGHDGFRKAVLKAVSLSGNVVMKYH